MLTLTLAPFTLDNELQKIPEMPFDASGADYWLLLPFFEMVEEKTGKLIDLGDNHRFDQQEIAAIQLLVDEELKKLDEEVNEDTLLERDNESQKKLLERLADILRLAAKFNVDFLATSS